MHMLKKRLPGSEGVRPFKQPSSTGSLHISRFSKQAGGKAHLLADEGAQEVEGEVGQQCVAQRCRRGGSEAAKQCQLSAQTRQWNGEEHFATSK